MTRVLAVDRSIRWGMLPGPVKTGGCSSPLSLLPSVRWDRRKPSLADPAWRDR